MKRLCLVLAFLFLFSQTAFAMPLLIGQKVVYRGTATGLRISSVDGTAFIDNAGATIPTYADGNHQIEIYDSSNRMLRGVLKAAGSSETLGDEYITGWTNSATAPMETLTINANGRDIDSFINDVDTIGLAYTSDLSSNLGKLYKIVADITVASGSAPRLITTRGTTSASQVIINPLVDGTYYWTVSLNPSNAQVDTGLAIQNINTAVNGSLLISAKPTTAPSSTGATIVSAKGGTTYNFNHKNASFVYNAASYYVIIKRLR